MLKMIKQKYGENMKKDKKYVRGQGRYDSLARLCRMIMIGFLVSFGGWVLETAMHYIRYGEYTDRGFLRLPLCPIYGASVILIAYFFGTPQALDGILDRQILRSERTKRLLKSKVMRYIAYFVMVTLISTAAELVIGGIFKMIGMPLWDYSDKAFNLFGVICLSYSLIWGVMITVIMAFLWRPMSQLFSKMPSRTAIISAFTLLVAATVDFTVNLILLLFK